MDAASFKSPHPATTCSRGPQGRLSTFPAPAPPCWEKAAEPAGGSSSHLAFLSCNNLREIEFVPLLPVSKLKTRLSENKSYPSFDIIMQRCLGAYACLHTSTLFKSRVSSNALSENLELQI